MAGEAAGARLDIGQGWGRFVALDWGRAMRVLVVVAAMLALGGCKSTEEKQAAQATKDEAYCTSIGVPAGSPNYAACRLRLTEQQSQERIARQQGGPTNCSSQRVFNTVQTQCY